MTNPEDRRHCLGSVVETSAAVSTSRWLRNRRRIAAALKVTPSNEEKAKKALRAACRCGRDHVVWYTPGGSVQLTRFACKRKHCPECMSDWSSELAARAITVASKVPLPCLRHLVMTIPNGGRGELKPRIDQLMTSWREWRNEGRRKDRGAYWDDVDGMAWKFEVHYSPRSGWHPHLHVLLDGAIDARKGSRAREHWPTVTSRYGPPASMRDGVWIVAPKSPTDAARELAKYAAKPIALGDMSATTLSELATATFGRRWHGSSGTMALGAMTKPGGSGWIMVGSASHIVAKAFEAGDHEAKDLALDVLVRVAADIAGDRERQHHALADLLGSYFEDHDKAQEAPHSADQAPPEELDTSGTSSEGTRPVDQDAVSCPF
jgi:hypothetical protein